MDVKILCKETIKPSIPTPQNLRNYKISFIDQFVPSSYVPVILFYNANAVDYDLKKSLAETLSFYYPLAGRFKDLHSIECNDEGVVYIEAQANFHLSKFLENPDIPFLNKFLPCRGNCLELSYEPLLALQTTKFECGGIAIGLCMFHKVADASAISAFLKTWAKITRGDGDKTLHPDFTSSISLFPPIESLSGKFIRDFENFYFKGLKSPMRRFLFDSKAIKSLKASTSSQNVPFPSRIEALTAFVCKRIAVASESLTDSPKTLMITHVANLRPRINPPLPLNSFGNLIWLAFSFYDPLNSSMELPELVIMLREVFSQLNAENIKELDSEYAYTELKDVVESLSTNENMKIYRFTSWCNMGFYDVNYGWGKPVWVALMGDFVATHVRSQQQLIFLESACGEGIELWIAYEDEEIRVLEKDPEFLAYAKPNPSKFTRDFENFYFQGSKSPMIRFLFDSKVIKSLNSNTASQRVPFPSPVEALTAFVCKRIAAASISLTDSQKTLMITHAANLRPRVEPPLPQKSFGNLLWLAFAFYDPFDTSIELPDLAIMLREVFS